jgi:arabinofuranosyltransferase
MGPQEGKYVIEHDSKQSDSLVPLITKALLSALVMYAVVTRMWACEDAYITFRYIDNLVHGLGLVYNVGEHVEGFTHPAWLFLVSIPSFIGVSIRASALWLSLLCTLIGLLIVAFRDRDCQGRAVLIPVALVLFATHNGFREFSASGLEFPLAFLLLAAFYVSYKKHDLLGKPLLHGTLLSLLYLTRPELVLLLVSFYLIEVFRAVVYLIRRRSKELGQWISGIVKLTLPILVIAGGYHLFRALYYGEFFPNTYYAKDGLGADWSQGLRYFEHFWRFSPILVVALFIFLLILVFSVDYRRGFFTNARRTIMLAQAALLTLYVVRLGGDFMAFRFLLPSLVITALTINDMFDYILGKEKLVAVKAVIALAVTLIFTFRPTFVPARNGYIADERTYYNLFHPAYMALFHEPSSHRWYIMGQEARRFRESSDYPIAIGTGNIGYLGYAAGPGVRIVDAYGLVDKAVARNWKYIRRRGRPGHELKLTLSMAVDKDVTFWETPFNDWNQMLTTNLGVIITLDPKLLKFFPDQIITLKALKARLIADHRQNEPIFHFLTDLENKYHVRIESL